MADAGGVCFTRYYKSSGPAPQYSYGCCNKVWMAFHTNAEVTANVVASNGIPITLSDEAVATIKASYTGKPLKVMFGRRCDCCRCESNAGCICCVCLEHKACPDEVDIDYIMVTEVWFAKESAESRCSGFLGCCCNTLFCTLPLICSKWCVPTAYIDISDVTVVSAAPAAVELVLYTGPYGLLAYDQPSIDRYNEMCFGKPISQDMK